MPPIFLPALLLVAYGIDRYVSLQQLEHFQQSLQKEQKHFQQSLQFACFIAFLFLFVCLYFVHEREKKRGKEREKERNLDRLDLGIYFATIWNVWKKDLLKRVSDVEPAMKRAKTPGVYKSLRKCVYADENPLALPQKLDDKEQNKETMYRCRQFTSIFGGPDKSLAHLIPGSWVCSWFYGSVAERLVGIAGDSNEEVSAKDRSILRYWLVHHRQEGLKYSDRNLLPLPKNHDDYFDKCNGDCLLIIPIMEPRDVVDWDGRAYDVLVVASSAEVYKWMKVDERFLEQKTASQAEVRMAAEALKAAVEDLLRSLVVDEDGPIADGITLLDYYEESNGQTPTTQKSVSFSAESSENSGKRANSSGSNSESGGYKGLRPEHSNLKKVKEKFFERGFPMPKLQENIRKPLLKVSLECLVNSETGQNSVPDPLALASKAAINWSAFATDGDMKLLTGCRVSPPIDEDCDSPETIDVTEEAILPTFINVPRQELTRPTARSTTQDRSLSPPRLVSPDPAIRVVDI